MLHLFSCNAISCETSGAWWSLVAWLSFFALNAFTRWTWRTRRTWMTNLTLQVNHRQNINIQIFKSPISVHLYGSKKLTFGPSCPIPGGPDGPGTPGEPLSPCQCKASISLAYIKDMNDFLLIMIT